MKLPMEDKTKQFPTHKAVKVQIENTKQGTAATLGLSQEAEAGRLL